MNENREKCTHNTVLWDVVVWTWEMLADGFPKRRQISVRLYGVTNMEINPAQCKLSPCS
jgi:hypothetical protein